MNYDYDHIRTTDDEGNLRHKRTTKPHFKEVSAGSAQIGSATAVTGGPVGDSGELVPLGGAIFPDRNYNTTSTTYTTFFASNTPYNLDFAALTNISEIYFELFGRMQNDTAGETTFARLSVGSSSLAEASSTGTGLALKSVREPTTEGGMKAVELQMKVTAGTGNMYNIGYRVWGKIE